VGTGKSGALAHLQQVTKAISGNLSEYFIALLAGHCAALLEIGKANGKVSRGQLSQRGSKRFRSASV